VSGFIVKLREKSPEEKRKITVWAAIIVTVVVAIFWIIFFFPGNANAPTDSVFKDIGRGFNEIIKSAKK